jgi:hypothetical protein
MTVAGLWPHLTSDVCDFEVAIVSAQGGTASSRAEQTRIRQGRQLSWRQQISGLAEAFYVGALCQLLNFSRDAVLQ